MAVRISATEQVRSVGLNTGYQIAAQFVPAIAAVIAIPFLLRHLGPELYGIMAILATALAYFSMLDLGLGRAATRFIAQSLESENPEDSNRYFWGSILLLNAVGLFATVVAVLVVPIFASRLLKISPVDIHVASQALYVICLTIPIVTLMATFRGFLEASGKFGLISVITGCGGVALYGLPVVAIIGGGGLLSVAFALAIARIGVCIALATACFRNKGRLSLKPVFDMAAVRRMLFFGGWLSVSNIVGTATIYADRILLGICVGMAAVASYSMPLDVIGRMQILITSFCAVLFPLMSRLEGTKSGGSQTVYRGAMAATLSIMTLIAAAAILIAPALMKAWLGSRCTADSIFAAQVFLAGGVVQSMASIAWTALHAKGRSDLTAWVHLVEFPIYIATFYFFAKHYGVRGAALVWVGRATADFLCMSVLLSRQGQHNRTWNVPREILAALISASILLIGILPSREAVPIAVLICIFTCVWAWRVLLDSELRMKLSQIALAWRAVAGPVA